MESDNEWKASQDPKNHNTTVLDSITKTYQKTKVYKGDDRYENLQEPHKVFEGNQENLNLVIYNYDVEVNPETEEQTWKFDKGTKVTYELRSFTKGGKIWSSKGGTSLDHQWQFQKRDDKWFKINDYYGTDKDGENALGETIEPLTLDQIKNELKTTAESEWKTSELFYYKIKEEDL